IDDYILQHFQVENDQRADVTPWINLIDRIRSLKDKVSIGLVGKYVTLQDAYLSVSEALKHAGFYHNAHVQIKWLNAEKINEKNYQETLKNLDGILVPGGFGERATHGKILAIKYARENNIPFFGI